MSSEDKYGSKWVVIRHLPKGMIYGGNINAINRTLAAENENVYVAHCNTSMWHHSAKVFII